MCIRDRYHPVTDEIVHIDFQKVKEDEKISLEVAVRSSGEAQGVKLGGLLVQILNSVTVECRPAEIPEFLEIDVSDMEMNTNLFVKDIILPEGVEMLTADYIAVVSVQAPKEEKEELVVEEDTESDEADETPEADEQSSEDNTKEESTEEAKEDNAGEKE